MMEEYSLPLYANRERRSISFPCLILCAIIVLLIVFLTHTPGSVTQLYRPAFIGACLVFLQRSRYPIPKGGWALIALYFYMGLVLLFTDLSGSSIRSYFSMVLFCGFFICAVCRRWTKREIRFILLIVSAAGLVSAIVVLIENPQLRSFQGASELLLLGKAKNRNTIAFSLVPAALCSEVILEYNRHKTLFFRIFCLTTLFITSFSIVASGCRSASFALFVGIFLIVWEMTQHGRNLNTILSKKILIALAAFAGLYVVVLLTRGTNSARLFNDILDGNGRDYLWEFAEELIRQKPVFGGGFAYWDSMGGSSLGTHNTVLNVMVISGWVGAVFLAFAFLTFFVELWKQRNYVLIAFLTEVVCHTYSESTMDYYAYLPLSLTYILFNYMKYQQEDLSLIFEKDN